MTAPAAAPSREPDEAARAPQDPPRWLLALALAAVVVLLFARLGGHPLQDPDEGRYAEIPREMIESGDWLTPHLNYVHYFEKPPLLYWMTAVSMEAFGQSEFAVRLVPAACALLTVLLVYGLGRSMWGRRAGLLGAATLATSPLFFAIGQALVIDMLLTACFTATLVGFAAARRAERKLPWTLLVAASTAAGVLAKGPVALVVPGAIALAFLGLTRDWPTLRALLRWQPIALFLVLCVPWFVLVARANDEFLQYFFVHEHLERFASNVGHPEGPFYYVPVLLLGPLPWSVLAIALAAHREGRRAFAALAGEDRLLLLLWAGGILGFFTVASSKLATYVLPALPPLALVLGAWLDRMLDDAPARLARILGGAGVPFLAAGAAFAIAGVGGWLARGTIAAHEEILPTDVAAVAGPVLATGLALLGTGEALRRGRRLGSGAVPALAVLVAGLGLSLLAAVGGRSAVNSTQEMAAPLRADLRDGDLLVSYRDVVQSLSFYARRRVIQFDVYGEIESGAYHAPDRADWFWDDEERFLAAWSSGQRMFVAVRTKHLPTLVPQLDPPPRLLGRDQNRMLLVNFDAPGSRPLRPEEIGERSARPPDRRAAAAALGGHGPGA